MTRLSEICLQHLYVYNIEIALLYLASNFAFDGSRLAVS